MAAAQYLDKDRLIMKLSRYDQNWFRPSSFLDARLKIKVLPPMTNYCKSFASAVINDMMKSPSGQTHSSNLPTEARLGQLVLGCCSFPVITPLRDLSKSISETLRLTRRGLRGDALE